MQLTQKQFRIVYETLDTPIRYSSKFSVSNDTLLIPKGETPLFYSFLGLSFYLEDEGKYRDEYNGALIEVTRSVALNFSDSHDGFDPDLLTKYSIIAYLLDKYEIKEIEENEKYPDGEDLGTPISFSYPSEYIPYVYEWLKDSQGTGPSEDNEESESSDGGGEEEEVDFQALVTEYMEKGEGEEKDEKSKGQEAANNQPSEVIDILEDDPIEMFKLFLTVLIDRRKRYEVDSLKHYNRNSRGTRDLMYSSIKRKVKTGQVKLGILLDVSGSIPTDVVFKAISSIGQVISLLDRQSLVLAWDDEYEGSWDLYSLPDKLYYGGGTSLSGGLLWLEKKGFDTIVVFSDFFMSDLFTFIDLSRELKVHYYPINSESYDALRVNNSVPKKCLVSYERVFRKV